MYLDKTGAHVGLDSIREYVNIQNAPHLFRGDLISLNVVPSLDTLTFDWGTATCEVTIAIDTCRSFNTQNVLGSKSAKTLIGYRAFFQIPQFPTSLDQIFIKRANIFYPNGYSKVFGEAIYTNSLAKKNCEITSMRDSCPDTWESNFPDRQDQIPNCMQRMNILTATESFDGYDGFIDDNSFGCRIMHRAYAIDNPNHCAHISFEEEMDPNGKIKCQDASAAYRVYPSDLFSVEMIFFRSCRRRGLWPS